MFVAKQRSCFLLKRPDPSLDLVFSSSQILLAHEMPILCWRTTCLTGHTEFIFRPQALKRRQIAEHLAKPLGGREDALGTIGLSADCDFGVFNDWGMQHHHRS